MLSIVARSAGAYREKPGEVVRGEASRLSWAWDRLCFAVPLMESSREGYRDVVGNIAVTTIGGTWAWGRDKRGNQYAQADRVLDNYVEWPEHPNLRKPTTEITAYARVQRTGSSDSFGGVFAREYISGSAPWTSWAITDDSAGTGKLSANITLGTTNFDLGSVATVTPTTEYCSLFFRWRSGTAPQLDILGERGNTIDSATYGSTLTGTIGYNLGKATRMNASEEAGSNYSGRYSQVMLWSRQLTDVEVTALVADPFGWYSPRRETVAVSSPFPLVTGGTALEPVFGQAVNVG